MSQSRHHAAVSNQLGNRPGLPANHLKDSK
jgi:hypothetical protein